MNAPLCSPEHYSATTTLRIRKDPKSPGTFKLTGSGTLPDILKLARETALIYAVTKPPLSSPTAVRDFLHGLLAHNNTHEEFHGLFLDTQNCLIEAVCLSVGTLDSAAVFPREVAKTALALNAASVIFAHNHPSGSPTPSAADRTITERLKAALALLDIRVLDHLVVTPGITTSLAERGWI